MQTHHDIPANHCRVSRGRGVIAPSNAKNFGKSEILREAIRSYLAKIRIFRAVTKKYFGKTNFLRHQ